MNKFYIKFFLLILFICLLSSSLLGQDVLDKFSIKRYDNQDGSELWNGDWIELLDGGSATNGRIQVWDNQLYLGKLAYNKRAIKRSVDLSSAISASLSIQISPNLGRGKKFAIQASTNGDTFVTVGEVDGSRKVTETYDISDYISPLTTIRLINMKRGKDWRDRDYVYVDNVEISYELGSDCSTSGLCRDYYLSNVKMGSINNPSTCDGYGDYTFSSTKVEKGNSYYIDVDVYNWSNYNVYYRLWADWNQDGDFGSDEEIIISGDTRSASTIITVPTGAELGVTRMRVKMMEVDNDDPCQSGSYWGEVEDYTLNVVANDGLPSVADCLNAKSICDAVYYEASPELEGLGNVINELPTGDCIPDEKNGIWYSFSPNNPSDADMKFSITPNDNTNDYDWVIFDMTNTTCAELSSIDVATSAAFVSGNTYGTTGVNGSTGANADWVPYGEESDNCNGIGDTNGPKWNADVLVKPGHNYMLYVSNWSAEKEGYEINFEEGGSAIIYDDVLPNLDGVVQACYGGNELKVGFTEIIPCGSLDKDNVTVTIGGQQYDVTSITSSNCDLGGFGSVNYIFILDRFIVNQGAAKIKITAAGISDMCGNVSEEESTLTFNVSKMTAFLSSNKNPACFGENITVTANLTGGSGTYTYEFFLNGADAPLMSDASYSIVGNKLSSGVFINDDNIKVKVFDENACSVISTEINISINPSSDIPSGDSDQSFCGGATVASLVVSSSDAIDWYTSVTGGTVLKSTDVLLDGMTYFAEARNAKTDCVSSSRFAVSVSIKPNVSIDLSSVDGTDSQSLCANTAITPITYTVSAATGASIPAGALPTGVNGSYVNGIFTISGTPSVAGVYSYTIKGTGGCGSSSMSGTITVAPNTLISLGSASDTDNQNICLGNAITDIEYSIANGTNAMVDGLPNGLSGNYNSGSYIISGIPDESGNFPYTVTTTGDCGDTAISGTITVSTVPSSVGAITGNSIVLTGESNVQYYCSDLDASSYIWSYEPSGGVTINGNSDNVSVDFTGDAKDGELTVRGVNACGEGGDLSSLPIQVVPSCQYTVKNWTFNTPLLAPGDKWESYGNNQVEGWFSSLNNIEIWRSGFSGNGFNQEFVTPDGGQFCELNSSGRNTMWQYIDVEPGSEMMWSVTYRYRSNSSEIIRLKIGPDGALSTIKDISNKTGDGWVVHSGAYTVPNSIPSGQVRFQIETVSPSGGSGNLIDGIQFYSVDSDLEGPGFDLPKDDDGDGFVVKECVEGVDLTVSDIGVTNLSDNCSSLSEITLDYQITNKPKVSSPEEIIYKYKEAPKYSATLTNASGFKFPIGENKVTYRATDALGQVSKKSFKILVSRKPNPIGIFF